MLVTARHGLRTGQLRASISLIVGFVREEGSRGVPREA